MRSLLIYLYLTSQTIPMLEQTSLSLIRCANAERKSAICTECFSDVLLNATILLHNLLSFGKHKDLRTFSLGGKLLW